MTPNSVQYISKTQLYLRVKKPILERQRRARMNNCLDTLKRLVAELQGDDAILRMDKAEMLECALDFIKNQLTSQSSNELKLQRKLSRKKAEMLDSTSPNHHCKEILYVDSFRNGFINAVNEVSRVMAATPGFNVDVGKRVMTGLGGEFNRVLEKSECLHQQQQQQQLQLQLRLQLQLQQRKQQQQQLQIERQTEEEEKKKKVTLLPEEISSSVESLSPLDENLMYSIGKVRERSHWRPW